MLIAPSLALVLAAAPAAAKIFTARPANSTVGKGGEPFRLSWMDDGEEPTLATIGPVRIDLCVGTGEKNVVVQEVAPAVDLSKQSNLTFTVDPKAGENGQYYFFKYTAADNVMGQAYSQLTARFFMTSMTGDWSSEQEALVASVSTAALPTETANVSTVLRGAIAGIEGDLERMLGVLYGGVSANCPSHSFALVISCSSEH